MAGTKVDPPPFKDQITDGQGNITPEFHDFLYRLWQRTGGDSDLLEFISKLQSNRVYQQQIEPLQNGQNLSQLLSALNFRTPTDQGRLDSMQQQINEFTASNVPVGGIIMWSGETVPDGWLLCDGENGTPDLRDRFVVGSGATHTTGDTGGNAAFTTSQSGVATGSDVQAVTDSEIPTLPPYYALAFIMKDEESA